jgi:DNA-binding SARP family transcriptional activator/Tfp pilus assembly protein PilF
MRRLNLGMLGGFALKTDEGAELVLPTRKDRQILAFLALQGGEAHSREKLAALLWADRAEAQARDSLRQSLAALRRVFRSVLLEPVSSDRVSVTLDVSAFTIDAIEFAVGCGASALTASIAGLYQGPLLDALDTATPEFEHWVVQERQRLDALAEHFVVAASLSTLSPKDADAAMQLARRLLAQDRMLEPVYRAMMRICQNRGERAAALKLYSTCREALGDDLGIAPDHETEDLYRDVLMDRSVAPSLGVLTEADRSESRPSIATLPFHNLTGNEKLNFLCEGLAEDITTGLGRFRSLLVIDRYSAAAVSSATSDTIEIGLRLGAAQLVQGSIQATQSRLRVTVRLVDSANRAQMWSDVFECDFGDTPRIPDRIVTAIIATVQNRAEHTIIVQSQKKPSMAAYECALRGIKHLRGYAKDDNDKAVAFFREALRLDPDYALVQAYLAFAEAVIQNYDDAPRDLLIDCRNRIDRALAIDPEDYRINWLLSLLHGYLREFDEEKRQLERALELNANDANSMMSYGSFQACFGHPDEGLAMIREAMRLNPFHPEWYWLSLGAAFMASRRYEDAIEAYNRRTRPRVWVLTRLAICYAHLGRDSEAREMARRVLEQNPDFRISALRGGGWSDADIAHMRDGLRRAGLPD